MIGAFSLSESEGILLAEVDAFLHGVMMSDGSEEALTEAKDRGDSRLEDRVLRDELVVTARDEEVLFREVVA